ncbi:flagellar hook-length control protein FliK [Devosia sp.]|uniref:flagellar hook-length control protein FliK n=1 Tax=Devosia sp. TaxID=1871048 RepID=UPI003A9078AE
MQAAARQNSLAPVLARLPALLDAAATLPQPLVAAAQKLLANRIDLARGAPTAATLKAAVTAAGIASEPGARPLPTDTRAALLGLRTGLLALLGDAIEPVAPVTRQPPPPLKGDLPRAPDPQPQLPPDNSREGLRQLLGHTEAAISRLKLMQLASQPPDPGRPSAQPAEFRVEVPLLFNAQTAMLQLQVTRDAPRRDTDRRPRGWRMRFAVKLAAIGEVGAEIALMGTSANVALWAAEPATADALEALLPELAPALTARGLEVTGVHLRRTPAPPKPGQPGRLLDAAT